MAGLKKNLCEFAHRILQDGDVSGEEIIELQEWLSEIEPPPDLAALLGLKRALVDYCVGELEKGRLQMPAAKAIRAVESMGDILLSFPVTCREQQEQEKAPAVNIRFGTPWNGDVLWQEVQGELQKAEQSIDIAAYTLTFDPMRNLLFHKAKGGIRIRLFVEDDKLWSYGDDVPSLAGQNNIEVRTDGPGNWLMHHKFIIIDRATVINGSLNFTRSGMNSNFENTATFKNQDIAELFTNEFDSLWHDGLVLKSISLFQKTSQPTENQV